jgi:predicted GNAT family N-acyltransferase
MPHIEILRWEKAREHAAPIRFAVFVEEQGVPPAIELDDMDAGSIHVIYFEDQAPVGTARLLPDGHIGRMAVLKPWRGRGIGGRMLGALLEQARRRGEREVALSAQVHALAFYRAHGFVEEGPEYLEAGIAHQQMRKKL